MIEALGVLKRHLHELPGTEIPGLAARLTRINNAQGIEDSRQGCSKLV
jgi:hypothetical protein